MSGTGATHYIISSLDDIAWLFNLRGGDIDFFPVNYAFAMITPAGVQLFMNMSKLTAGAAAMLDEQGVTIDEYDRFLPQLDILPPDAVVALDPGGPPFRSGSGSAAPWWKLMNIPAT